MGDCHSESCGPASFRTLPGTSRRSSERRSINREISYAEQPTKDDANCGNAFAGLGTRQHRVGAVPVASERRGSLL